jgi:hypothetical protein
MTAKTNLDATTRAAFLLILLAATTLLAAGCGDQQAAIAERGKEQAAENDANKGAETGNGEDRAAAPRAPRASAYTLPSGTVMVGSLQNTINTGKNDEGDPVRLRVTTNERVGGVVVVPAGSSIRGVCTHVDGAGRVAGGAELTIRWTDLQLPDGRSYAISAVPLRLKGKGHPRRQGRHREGGRGGRGRGHRRRGRDEG